MRKTKADINAELADLVGVDPPHMSTGSTEPKQIFILINDVLGLGLTTKLTKPQLARAIVEASGAAWTPDCESRGSTVTLLGMERVLQAVRLFVRRDMAHKSRS
jgi:hypothetical protein